MGETGKGENMLDQDRYGRVYWWVRSPAVLPGNRCTDAAPVIVIVQRRVGRLIRPVAGAVVATVCGDRSTDGSAQGEQDHNADAGAEIHECLPVCP